MPIRQQHKPTEDYQAIFAEGKVVSRAFFDRDSSGYDFVQIEFTDGSAVMVKEEGQAGYISYHVGFIER
jgi:hypothetical protein